MNRPEMSSEEIAKRKNFDSVLKNHGGISGKPLFKKPWFLSSMIVATVAIVTAIVFLNQQPTTNNQQLTTNNQQLTTNPLAEFYKNEEAKPCINPPLEGLNIPYTSYKVIAEKGATLDFKTGSKIIIPKNAFADENGKIVKGEIELRYREFHDAADFFVSGIPMTYDSAGVRYQFESAGMMEILAYQDGKQVKMTQGKSIEIELASNYKSTEHNLYELDTVKNNWTCLGKDKVVRTKSLSNKIGIAQADSIKYAASVQQTPEYKTFETKKEEVKKEKEIKTAALSKPIPEPKKPVLAKKEKYTFNIEVDAEEYPELAIYKGLLFEVGDENKNFNKSMYDITWDDALISQGSKKGENYLLTLKKATKKYDLVVYPVFEGKNYETAMRNFQDKFNKYTTALDKRKVDEKRIEEEYQAKLIALKKQQEELERKWKQEMDNQFKQMSTEAKVKRMFAINRFGVYNCDKPSVFPKGVLCAALLKTDNDRKLKCYDIYLVDKQKNGLFSYSRNPITSFSFNPQSTNMLWTVEDGILYWLKPEDFSSIKSGDGTRDLKLTRVDKKFATVDELKAYFNF